MDSKELNARQMANDMINELQDSFPGSQWFDACFENPETVWHCQVRSADKTVSVMAITRNETRWYAKYEPHSTIDVPSGSSDHNASSAVKEMLSIRHQYTYTVLRHYLNMGINLGLIESERDADEPVGVAIDELAQTIAWMG